MYAGSRGYGWIPGKIYRVVISMDDRYIYVQDSKNPSNQKIPYESSRGLARNWILVIGGKNERDH